MLLTKEFRGRNTEEEDAKKMYLGKKNYLYGEGNETVERIDGVELLKTGDTGIDIECDRLLDDKDFKRIRALKRKKMFAKQIKKLNEEEDREIGMHVPEFDILKYAKKQKMVKIFKEDPDNIAAFNDIDLDELDEEELIGLISDEDEADNEGDDEDEDEMDEEDIDPEEYFFFLNFFL